MTPNQETYTFDQDNFTKINYGEVTIYFDKNSDFSELIVHKRKIKAFPFHKNLIEFLNENKNISIYFTLNSQVSSFQKCDGGFLVNYKSYADFCRSIESRTKGRAQAFLGKHISLEQMFPFGEDEKVKFIKSNLSEDELAGVINLYPDESKDKIIKALKSIDSGGKIEDKREITKNEFIDSFSRFLSDNDVQNAFLKGIPKLQVETLKQHLSFLENNLDKDEKFIQNWIDENNRAFVARRCLIFGIEYVDPRREGNLSQKRFDILANQNRTNHVLIELKSPNAEVFRIEKTSNNNGGVSTEYRLSEELSRAIPQVLGYKSLYDNASNVELEKLGLSEKKIISKCLIIIGQSKSDSVWKENIQQLRSNLGMIELLTYTDLIDKLKNTIKNLEENL